jgi:hypothetical protein
MGLIEKGKNIISSPNHRRKRLGLRKVRMLGRQFNCRPNIEVGKRVVGTLRVPCIRVPTPERGNEWLLRNRERFLLFIQSSSRPGNMTGQ